MTADGRLHRLLGVRQRQALQHRIPEFVREETVDHSRPPGLPEGIEGVKAILCLIRQGFPDHVDFAGLTAQLTAP